MITILVTPASTTNTESNDVKVGWNVLIDGQHDKSFKRRSDALAYVDGKLPSGPVVVKTAVAEVVAKDPCTKDKSKLAHHAEIAAECMSQVVFSMRYFRREDGPTAYVTYSRAMRHTSGSGQSSLNRMDYGRLLEEAESLSGGRRVDGTFSATWLPEGVRSVSIHWIAPVRNDRSDTFRMTLNNEIDLYDPSLTADRG